MTDQPTPEDRRLSLAAVALRHGDQHAAVAASSVLLLRAWRLLRARSRRAVPAFPAAEPAVPVS